MQNWTCIDKIFTGNIKEFPDRRYGNIDKETLLQINPPYIETATIKPIFAQSMNSLVYQEIIRIYRDGKVERFFPYNAREPIVDGTIVLNPVGKKMLDYIIFKEKTND